MAKWLPIKSAPKDGTVFIALGMKGVCRCKWDIVDWDDEGMRPSTKWWTNPDDPFWFEMPEDAPTQWMPMPEPRP